MTLPWDTSHEISVFVDADPDFIFGDVALPCAAPHVEVLMHPVSSRGKNGPHDSELSEHPILIEQSAVDVGPIDDDGIQRPYSGSKIGGRPYYIHGDSQLESAVQALIDDGHAHIVQMDFPSAPQAGVSGPWAFGTGMVHVLGRLRQGEVACSCFWEL